MITPTNSVQLIGNVGTKPELKSIKSGATLAKFTLATNEFYTNAQGEKVQETQWHKIVAWGKIAEWMANKLNKGTEVLINGKITYNSYDGKDGKPVYYTEIRALDFRLLNKSDLKNTEKVS